MSTPLSDPRLAAGLRKATEARAGQVARSVLTREVRRTVVDVYEPRVGGAGGRAVVADGLGDESTVRWFEHRPAIGDNVVVSIPPPGGTRRIVAIDREMPRSAAGLATASGLTMNTATMLGRATADVGAIEEIAVTGSGSAVLATSPSIAAPTLTGKVTAAGLQAVGGSSFPASPATNDLFYRTDLGLEFCYDGTRWLSKQLFTLPMRVVTTTVAGDTTAYARIGTPPAAGGSDIWLVRLTSRFFVGGGGSALSGSHKWVGTLNSRPSDNSNTAILASTPTVNSGSSAVWRSDATDIGALLHNGTTMYLLTVDWTMTGAPGTMTSEHNVTYRVVAT